jgi:predicted esterase
MFNLKIDHIQEIAQIKSIVFGADKPCNSIYVYLHGAGEFRTGYDGQYQYPGFASLLRDCELKIEQPFVIACCMEGDHWVTEQLATYLSELSSRFGKVGIDIIGYSRGGRGVYDLLMAGVELNSATVINSRLPELTELPKVPVHIIHATNDQLTSASEVVAFVSRAGNEVTSYTAWQGDHFSVVDIAHAGIWRKKVRFKNE